MVLDFVILALVNRSTALKHVNMADEHAAHFNSMATSDN